MLRPAITVPALIVACLIACASDRPALAQGFAEDGVDPAEIEKMTAAARQVPLTGDMVDRLVVSFEEMRTTGAQFPDTQLPDEPAPSTSDLDAMPADKRTALDAVATKHGFENLQQWSDVANTVVMTYIFMAQGKKPGSVADAVRMNTAQAARNPNLTPEQKQQTVALYRQIGDALQRIEPSKENYTLVVEMKDELAPIMDPQ